MLLIIVQHKTYSNYMANNHTLFAYCLLYDEQPQDYRLR